MRISIVFSSILLLVKTEVVPSGPLTRHFQDWLISNGYEKYDYARLDMDRHGSFGGKVDDYDQLVHEPVVFIHGNSDAPLKANNFSTGFTNTTKYFLSQNYTYAELYATAWGDTNTTQAILRDHDCATVNRIRQFILAVLAYTKSPTVRVISHSMGVTLARKAIIGGYIEGKDGACNLGAPLKTRVSVMLAIAGAHYGMCICVNQSSGTVWPTCNDDNGLWPGDNCGNNDASACSTYPLPINCRRGDYSEVLKSMNTQAASMKTFSMWSQDDTLIGETNFVWGRATSEAPDTWGNMIYRGLSHMQTKELTCADQFHIITQKSLPK